MKRHLKCSKVINHQEKFVHRPWGAGKRAIAVGPRTKPKTIGDHLPFRQGVSCQAAARLKCQGPRLQVPLASLLLLGLNHVRRSLLTHKA